jgi:hypothetical protein
MSRATSSLYSTMPFWFIVGWRLQPRSTKRKTWTRKGTECYFDSSRLNSERSTQSHLADATEHVIVSDTCVHKVHSGFWKIVARKQIELATCGLRQITAKLWKFFFWSHSNSIIPRQTYRCPQSPLGVLKNCGTQTNWARHMRFVADYSETLEVFFIPFKFDYPQTNIQVSTKFTRGFGKLWRANRLS